MKRKYKFLAVILASLCILSFIMLPSYAATVYYEYEGDDYDSSGNCLHGVILIGKKDSVLHIAAATGDLTTSNELPTTHYVYLIAKIRVSYEEEPGVFYYRKGTNSIGHLTGNRSYSVLSSQSVFGGGTLYLNHNPTVAYIDGWTKLSFTDNQDRNSEVVSGLSYYNRKTPAQIN